MPGTGGRREGSAERILRARPLAVSPWMMFTAGHADGHGAGVDDRVRVDVLDPRGYGAQHGPGPHGPAHPHLAIHPLDAPAELRPGQASLVAGDERIRHPDAARRSTEQRREDVRAAQVAPGHGVVADGRQLDAAARLAVEEGCERGKRVEVGDRQPVDASVSGDQGDGPSVADRGIFAQGRRIVHPRTIRPNGTDCK